MSSRRQSSARDSSTARHASRRPLELRCSFGAKSDSGAFVWMAPLQVLLGQLPIGLGELRYLALLLLFIAFAAPRAAAAFPAARPTVAAFAVPRLPVAALRTMRVALSGFGRGAVAVVE